MQNIIGITAPENQDLPPRRDKRGASEEVRSSARFMGIGTSTAKPWGKSLSRPFRRQIHAQDASAALSTVCPAQLTVKSSPNFPILLATVLLDSLVVGTRDELQTWGNSNPLLPGGVLLAA